MKTSLFETYVFDNEGRIVGTRTKEEVRHKTFDLNDWKFIHVNKRSLTLINKFNGELFLIGARTFNELHTHSRFVKYVKVPNPKNPGQILNWIKIDK